MQLNTARQAWHDAYYQPWDSVMSHALEMAQLEAAVQKTEKQRGTTHAVHQALAGRIQLAIDTLPRDLKRFGHHLYNPLASRGDEVEANLLVWRLAKNEPMSQQKETRAFAICCGVVHRYRMQHQGGQSSMPDPLPSPEAFRAWILERFKLAIRSENWGRDWAGFVQACFDVCCDLDRKALGPVAAMLGEMKEAA
ncbi:hypothetical protein SA496_15600 [Pseudomonas sp. JS3066]|jgi:hypothetical protein|uniref:hypothetical protein n=1 Tax=Pseudomonas sp. JS3066 TaxID=3090665 RepID=UPI002E7B48AB|nr:hypothetical protein [Pseudomonas sp. JS3066]WVK91153.1 hypothetical protein SA496_15600 [Pseudomonas sp. JS3066]